MAKIRLFLAPSITIPNLLALIFKLFKRGQFWTYPTLKAIKIFIGRLSVSRVKGKTYPSTALPTKRRLPVHGLISALIHKQQAHKLGLRKLT